MKQIGCAAGGGLALLAMLAIAAAAPGAANAALVLKSGGEVAPVGTGATGKLRFGACGEFTATGSLTVNGRRTDRAGFSSTEGSPGGCAEGGPVIEGSLSEAQLGEKGSFVVVTDLTYTRTSDGCAFYIKRLRGTFAIPGPAEATLAGVAYRSSSASAHCPKMIRLTGIEAGLYDLAAGTLFQTEL